MKKSTAPLIAFSVLFAFVFLFLVGISMTSCDNKAQNVADAEKNVKEATISLDKANKEQEAEIEKFKKEAADKIAANEKSIAQFKARKEADRKVAEADYNKEVLRLEQKNSDMKKKMDDYKFESVEKWEIFKSDFGHGMEELGKAFTDIGENKSK
jgi:F0F1-type ATP synthase membrane subunit b/b'